MLGQALVWLSMYFILIQPAAILAIAFIVITVLGNNEIFAAVAHKDDTRGSKPLKWFSCTALAFIPLILTLTSLNSVLLFIFAYLFIIAAILIVTQDTHSPFIKFSTSLMALCFTLAISTFCLVKKAPQGTELCLFLFFLINCSDIAGLIFGKLLGKHPLISRVSPTKTIEGALGSFVTVLGLSLAFRSVLRLEYTFIFTLTLAVITNISAQFGDLAASLFKRDAGIDEYGRLIPGHGGILDRLDSCLFAVPLVYVIISILNNEII